MPSRREELELVPVVAPASNSTPAMSRNWRWASSRNCAKPVSLQAEAQQITAGLEQQHEAELARRQAALVQWPAPRKRSSLSTPQIGRL